MADTIRPFSKSLNGRIVSALRNGVPDNFRLYVYALFFDRDLLFFAAPAVCAELALRQTNCLYLAGE